MESDRRFGIQGVARVVEGNGGLFKVRVERQDVAGEMYLHGAHVTSWQPAGAQEVLFVSEHTRLDNGRAIRGGIPVCFPWFGNKPDDAGAPAHGFVRTEAWRESGARSTTHGEGSRQRRRALDRPAESRGRSCADDPGALCRCAFCRGENVTE